MGLGIEVRIDILPSRLNKNSWNKMLKKRKKMVKENGDLKLKFVKTRRRKQVGKRGRQKSSNGRKAKIIKMYTQ